MVAHSPRSNPIDTLDDALARYDDRYSWWFGEDNLSEASIIHLAEWKEHPFDALEVGKGLTLYRREEGGQIEHRDAAGVLTAFACFEAFQLIHLWDASEVVREYLRTADPRLSNPATVAVRTALDAADLELQNAARLQSRAEANIPKLGFFARSATRAAAWSAAQQYAQAVAAHTHRAAIMHAVGAALYATAAGACGAACSVANEVIEV